MNGNQFISLDNNVFNMHYESDYRYDASLFTLLPVVIQIHSENRSQWPSNHFGYKEIREALANLNLQQLYTSVVEWIELQNKRKNN